jgi:aspartyl protease family protein
MFKQFAPLFAIAVLIGWFMPSDEPISAPAQRPAETGIAASQPIAPLPAATAPIAAATQQQGVQLLRAQNGHFFVMGDVDGAMVNFIVDTGASVIALTANDAQKLGQTWYPNELQVVGRGANGDVIGKPIMLSRVKIGHIEVLNVRAVIIPQGLDTSLLGQSFLSQIPNVNISGDRMTLG